MDSMKRAIFFISLLLAVLPGGAVTKPKLVVNIVVSQLRPDYLDRFGDNFCQGGFRRLASSGTDFSQARYNYLQTNTPAGLATLTTGANPAVHGVIGSRWVDYVNNKTVALADDPHVAGLDCDAGKGCYSPLNLTVPTLGDHLLAEDTLSKVVTVALDPASAVVLGGFTRNVYWMDSSRGTWVSSSHYMQSLPRWVKDYNTRRPAEQYLGYKWEPVYAREKYHNSKFSVMDITPESRFRKVLSGDAFKGRSAETRRDYPAILSTPAANTLVKEFAKQAFIYEDLGRDAHTDILNICFDASRLIGEEFGGGSMELEDMLCRLDLDLAELIDFLSANIKGEELLIVLTSDHGASDATDREVGVHREFNSTQMRMIVGGFMNSQFGAGDWITGYFDGQLYLNRTLMGMINVAPEVVQNRVASFALQFQGISHTATATGLANGVYAPGWGEKAANSFYPKRSGDVVMNLVPGWLDTERGVVATGGSMYDYDTHVPLYMMGCGLRAGRVEDDVDMTSLAPTLARIMQINRPVAATGRAIGTIVNELK